MNQALEEGKRARPPDPLFCPQVCWLCSAWARMLWKAPLPRGGFDSKTERGITDLLVLGSQPGRQQRQVMNTGEALD